jgi:hypothetical protein
LTSAGLREPVRHPDRRALLQRQDVTEIIREVTQQRQLVRTRVPEDGGDPVSTQDLEEGIPHVHDHVPPAHGTWPSIGPRAAAFVAR